MTGSRSKLHGRYVRRVINERGNYEYTFECSRVYDILLDDQPLTITIEKQKSRRTIEQNAYMWAIIHDIAEHRNGRANSENEWDVYIEALEQAGAKYEVITCVPDAEELLRQSCRAVKLLTSTTIKGRQFNAYKCFYGSSAMTKQEMADLLDEVLIIASKEGINT